MVSSAIIRRRRGSTSLLSLYAVLGIRPELALDFDDELYFKARTPTTFGDALTHSASSNATMVDSDGLLKWRPHNLLRYSEDFTEWLNFNTPTVTENAVTSPSGAQNATALLANGTVGFQQVYNTAALLDNTDYTISIYFKAAVGDSGVRIALTGKDNTTRFISALSDGTISVGAGVTNATINNVGDGWYRLSAVVNSYSGATTPVARIYITSSDGNISTMVDGDGVYIWGAHLYRSDLGGMVSNPDRGDSYVPTTSAANYLPRRGHHVYNGSAWVNEGLLHESEARTNLVPLSVPDTSGWAVPNITLTPNNIVSPTGSVDATKIVATTSNAEHYIEETFSVTSGAQYTFSVFLKKLGYSNVVFRIPLPGFGSNAYILINMDDGTAAYGGGTIDSFGVQDFGNGWLRAYMTRTASSDDTALFRVQPNTISAYVGDDASGAYVWGAQAEVGPTPSSYIPNAGATAGARREAETLTIPAANLPWPTPEYIGPELVTNGTFDTASDWTLGANATISGGTLNYSGGAGNGDTFQNIGLVVGKVYLANFTVINRTAGSVKLRQGGVSGGGTDGASSDGDYVGIFVVPSGANSNLIIDVSADFVGSIDNISVREINPLAVSIQMDGRVTFSDENVTDTTRFIRWVADGSNYIFTRLDTDIGTGAVRFFQANAGVADNVVSGGSVYAAGILAPFNIASRHGSTFIAGAVDGVDIGDDLTPVALPDLSATDLNLGHDYNGTIRTFRIWADDIGDTGLVEATEPSLVPSLSLTFDGTENSFIVEDWSE